MSAQEALLKEIGGLTEEQQQKLLTFARALSGSTVKKPPFRSPEGLWADLSVNVTAEDIAQARKEMWGHFPRKDICP